MPEHLIVAAIWSVGCEHKIILVEENDEAVGTGRQVVLRTSSNSWSLKGTAYMASEESKCL